MKFFKYDTSTELARPCLRSWLVIFICGFLTACIIAMALGLLTWVVALAFTLLKGGVPTPFQHLTIQAAVIIILKAAAVFGALVATVLMLELLRRSRQQAHVKGTHPVIGDYAHRPFYKTWHAEPILPTSRPVRLSGYGSGPSEVQTALWQQFIAQYDGLIATATHSLLSAAHPLQGAEQVKLAPSGITLALDGGLHVGFEYSTVPEDFVPAESEPHPYPTASFTKTLELKSTEWLNDYA